MKLRVFESPFVLLPSSSSWKLDGLIPPPAKNVKSWPPSGSASLTTVIVPAVSLRFENVQMTVSPGATSMFDVDDPSEQLVWAAPQPAGVDCETE